MSLGDIVTKQTIRKEVFTQIDKEVSPIVMQIYHCDRITSTAHNNGHSFPKPPSYAVICYIARDNWYIHQDGVSIFQRKECWKEIR